MLSIYRFDDKTGRLNPQSRISPGVWINVVNPTPKEREQLQTKANLSEAFLLYGLDPDEAHGMSMMKTMTATCLFLTCPLLPVTPEKK